MPNSSTSVAPTTESSAPTFIKLKLLCFFITEAKQ